MSSHDSESSKNQLGELDSLKKQQRLRELQVLADELKTVKSGCRVYVQQRNSQICFLDNISAVRLRVDKELCSLSSSSS